MKKLCLLVFIALFTFATLQAQEFEKLYRNFGNKYCRAAGATFKDGFHYQLLSYSNQYQNQHTRGFAFLKIDTCSNIVIEKRYEADNTNGYQLPADEDLAYFDTDYIYITLQTNKITQIDSNNYSSSPAHKILKLNYNGDTIYSKSIDTNNIYTSIYSIHKVDAEHLILTGQAWGYGQSLLPSSLVIIKTDLEGNILWRKYILPQYYIPFYLGYGKSVFDKKKNRLIIMGSYRKNTPNGNVFYNCLVAADTSGGYLFDKVLTNDTITNSLQIPNITEIIISKNENYIVGGSKSYLKPYLAKVDTSFNIIWQKDYLVANPSQFFVDVKENEDSSIMAVGRMTTTESNFPPFVTQTYSRLIFNVNSMGDSLSIDTSLYLNKYRQQFFDQITIGHNNKYSLFSFLETNDPETLDPKSFTLFFQDIPSCALNSITENTTSNFKLYPNPNNGNFNIVFNEEVLGYKITNALGISMTSVLNMEHKTGTVLNIFTNNLPNGLYYISLQTKNKVISNTFIINHQD